MYLGGLRCDITDHYATILIRSNYIQNNLNKWSNIIKLSKVNINNLKLLINTENWQKCLDWNSVDAMVEVLSVLISKINIIL